MTGALGAPGLPARPPRRRQGARRARRAKVWHYRPRPAVAMAGVVVLALVAGGLGVFGGSADRGPPGRRRRTSARARRSPSATSPGTRASPPPSCGRRSWSSAARGRRPRSSTPARCTPASASGDIDFQTDAWLPDHATPSTGRSTGTSWTTSVPGTARPRWSWPCPSYVKGVDSLDDLKGRAGQFDGQDHRHRAERREMGTAEEQGPARSTAWTSEYEVVDSSTPAMLAELKRAYEKKEPVVVTLWSPHWAYSHVRAEEAQGPEGRLGQGRRRSTPSPARASPQTTPTSASWLKDFKLTEEQLTGLEARSRTAGKGKEQDGGPRLAEDEPRRRRQAALTPMRTGVRGTVRGPAHAGAPGRAASGPGAARTGAVDHDVPASGPESAC